MGQEFESGSAGHFWLGVFYEVAVRQWAGTGVISQPSFTYLAPGLQRLKQLGTRKARTPQSPFSFFIGWLKDPKANVLRETESGRSHLTIYDLALESQVMLLLLHSTGTEAVAKVYTASREKGRYRHCLLKEKYWYNIIRTCRMVHISII